MSTIYRLAFKYYNTVLSNGERLWSTEQLRSLVIAGKLTAEEFKTITGEEYTD